MKRLYYILIAYLCMKTILFAFGLIGEQNNYILDYALLQFPRSVIDTGTERHLFGTIASTVYSITAIILFFIMIEKALDKRVVLYIHKKCKYDFCIVFFSTVILLFLLNTVRLPFAVYGGYYLGVKYELVNTALTTWLLRYLGSSAISILAVSLLLSVLFITIQKVKKYILYIPLLFLIIVAGFTIIYPRYITPLFYETASITDKELKRKIMQLSNTANVNIKDIKIINKSKYHSYINAYLVGFGNQREIYLYDTLLKKCNHDQVLSILAHEMGHYVEEHMLIGIISATIGSILFFLLISKLTTILFGHSLPSFLSRREYWKVLLIVNILLFFIKPIENGISRQIEWRADNYALGLLQKPDVFISMKIKSAVQNKSYLLPHPVFRWFYYTHPSVLERIANAESYKKNFGK